MIISGEVLGRARRILADTTSVRWTVAELVDYCKDAVRQIVLVRPDAYSITRWMTLRPGDSRQIVGMTQAKDGIDFGSSQFDPTLRVLRVVRNGATGAFAPIREASRVAMDSEVIDWHIPAANPSGYRVEHYVFDNIAPHSFYVYPAPPTGLNTHTVEIIHSALPAFTGNGESVQLGLPQQYMNPLVDWVLYRAFSKDAEYAGNASRATHHAQAFAVALDITKAEGFMASSPQAATPQPASSGWSRTGP